MPYDSCDDEKTLDLIESEMANRGVTQEYIDEQRGLPEKEMLDDMKYLHQRNLPLDTRMPDNSTYVSVGEWVSEGSDSVSFRRSIPSFETEIIISL